MKNEIEKIIKSLDSINNSEWNRKENESEEDFEKRIQDIEDKIEDEIIDIISDSILKEEKIDENAMVREAKEKIKKEYEIYKEAFEKDSEEKIILKSRESLNELGYNSEEEIEKLKLIEENFNNPENYINKLKRNIKEKEDLNSEIERKLEIAKIIITAKSSKQEEIISDNKEKKYKENNEYIKDTNQLNKIPVIQDEFIYNSMLIRDSMLIRQKSIPKNQINNSNLANTNTNYNYNMSTYENLNKKTQVFKNLQKKIDKSNNETKEKILARIELKKVFMDYENQKLSANKMKEIKSKIVEIRKKYPEIVNDKLILKLFDEYKIKQEEELINENEQENDNQNDEIAANNKMKDKNTRDERRSEVLRIIEKCENEKENVFEISPNLIIYIATYLKNNDDFETEKRFKKIIKQIEEFTGESFIENIQNFNGYFDIRFLEVLRKMYNEGISKETGEEIFQKDINKSKDFLSKELDYILYLKKQVDNEQKNPSQQLKNEARFSQLLDGVKETSIINVFPGIKLLVISERLKRLNNDIDYEKIISLISKYKEKIKSGKEIGLGDLEILGEISYNGIKSKDGTTILSPDNILAKEVYLKLIRENKERNNEVAYNRLFSLYNNNTLPIYDREAAKKIKETMEKKGIKVQEKNNKKKKENQQSEYVCSDLHGNYAIYKTIVDKLKTNDKLYILGDAIDRGPDGIKILQDIMKRKEKGQIEFFIGNHEYMMIQALIFNDTQKEKLWIEYNGGEQTRNSFKNLEEQEQEKIKEFLLDSLVYKQINVNNQDYYLVHAKAIKDSEKNSQTVREMINSKSKIEEAVWSRAGEDCDEKDIAKEGTLTIIGHTPTESKKIEFRNGYIDIDCGAGYDINASLVNLSNGEVQYFNVHDTREKEKI